MQEDQLKASTPSKAQQSWRQAVSGASPRSPQVRFDTKATGGVTASGLRPKCRQIDANELLAKQDIYAKPIRGEYRACFEATASLQFKQQSLRKNREPTNGRNDPAAERVRLEAVFWKVTIRAIVWNLAPDGDSVYSVFDNFKDRLGPIQPTKSPNDSAVECKASAIGR